MQRRLAAIIAADVVGYSRLMGDDEAGTLERLKALRKGLVQPTIAKRKGRIVKLMGDGLLAEFPSVVEAVQCALDIQKDLAGLDADLPDDYRIKLRVGVNLGDLIVEGSDIYGDGVNVAARLEGLAEPGGICVSGKVYDEIKSKLEISFEDLGDQVIKNIRDPVRVYRWTDAAPVLATGVGEVSDALMLSGKPSIAVLPFDNMSGDPEQEYFSDGITEDIITALSRFRNLLVIARNTTFIYKGKAISISEISRELNARYVVEGSVRKSGNSVRVTAQLIDSNSGSHIWADRYDGVLEDIFDYQDQVTSSIVTAIAPQYLHAEMARATGRDAQEFSTWDLLMRARWHMGQFTSTDTDEAEQLLREVLRHNPRDAAAHAWLAFLYLIKVTWGWEQDPSAAMHEGIAAGRRAAALDNTDAQVLAISGLMMTWERSYDRGIETCRRAVQQNQNLALAHGMLAAALGIAGHYDEAREALAAARRLSPLDPEIPCFQTAVALGAFAAEEYQDVLDIANEVIAINPDIPSSHRHKAAALVMLGQVAEAKAAVKRLLQVAPNYSIQVMREFLPISPETLERHIKALRKAGLPE